MSRSQRDLRRLIEREGCAIVALDFGNGHAKARVRLPNGEERLLVTSKTPSDHRTEKAIRARLRRWVAGRDAAAS